MPDDAAPMAELIEGRLDRLGLTPEDASRAAGLPPDFLDRLLAGKAPPPRGQRLVRLAEALATSVSYLVGLDPDTPPPLELLEEEQGSLGLLAGDEEALLRAYRRLDLPQKAALVLVVRSMAGPEPAPDLVAAKQLGRRKGPA
ncbi:helix-turn-helix domain-containing protein [Paracraurococcus ruber]|uniref:HTH cro/C1-type domain-containing protein n=1 Tax=Paracraurococcus ruber TaxID=77675 RepID=A0ABS1D8Q6_9PROT|nr:helix-turn-helix transcriptional regulator [Paracraurococcus ruber]MBK1662254.1 hypothetical protein [Paracraurococcus ruber]TDG29715.1 XRE family transcriptional regulator [Paracraurococcus ruber]